MMNLAHAPYLASASIHAEELLSKHDSGVYSRCRLPTVGTLIQGRLRVTDRLGHGSTGTVFEAWDETWLREVALKFVHPDAGGDGAALLFEEFSALMCVRHPSLPEVYSVSDCPHGMYLELERLDPRSLADRADAARLPLPRALDAVDHVAEALDALHAARYVHRDVKAENVLFRDDRAVLVDLGLATHERALSTRNHLRLGSPAYLAPELLSGGLRTFEVLRRADLYALAVTAYHALTSRLPFESDSVVSSLFSRALSDPPRPSSLRPGLSASVDAVMHKALSRVPSWRYDSGADFVRSLRCALI